MIPKQERPPKSLNGIYNNHHPKQFGEMLSELVSLARFQYHIKQNRQPTLLLPF